MGTKETMGEQEQFRWDNVNFGWECTRFGIKNILQWYVEDVKCGSNYIDPNVLERNNNNFLG